jgi:outer membrane lipoprotein-sorting protein
VKPALLCIFLFTALANAANLPTTAPSGIDSALWERMKSIDHAAAQIGDLTADFEQQKFTTLLKNPMTSTGTVWARGSEMLWNTRVPEPTIMHVDANQITLFYPRQKTAEIYSLDSRLARLAASPVPRLADLLQHFSFAPAHDLDAPPNPDQQAFLLTPTDKNISEHVENVTVLIDAKAGFILAFKMTDADGETTVLRFSNVKTNTKFDDSHLQLQLPADVKTVHPLENIGRQP